MKKKTAPKTAPAFRHVLVPTDGSKEGAALVSRAIALARDLGARLRAVYLPPKRPPPDYGLGAIHGAGLLIEHFDAVAAADAKKLLAEVKAQAAAQRVACVGEVMKGHDAWEALMKIAEARRCDLLVVAPLGPLPGEPPKNAARAILRIP